MKTKTLLSTLSIMFYSTLSFAQTGTLDESFKVGSGANGNIHATAIQSDGKIIIGGDFTTYDGKDSKRIARLNTDGSLDSSFDVGTGFNGLVNSLAIQNNGKILIGGSFFNYNGHIRSRIARLNTDGTLDTTFKLKSGANNTVFTISIQNDGKIIIGGQFTTFNNIVNKGITRLNPDGSLDDFFNTKTGASDIVYSTSIQSDGKIIIGGSFDYYTFISRKGIARLNSDGSLDNSFNPGSGAFGNVRTTSLQNDGKIIIGGTFKSYNGTSINGLARLNTDGSIDNSFNPGTGATEPFIETSAIQSNGQIIIGGLFTTYNGTSRNRIARVNTDGSLDLSFNPGIGANNFVRSISIQDDGKIIIGGEFTGYNGTHRYRIARLFVPGVSVPNIKEDVYSFDIYPNPFSTHTTLQSDHNIQDGTLTIYNSLGEIVSQINNINGPSITIERSNLTNGLYFIRLTEGSQELMMKKVIVVD